MAAVEGQTLAPYEVGPNELPPKPDMTVEYGRTGTLNFQGFLQSEEYNTDLLPPKSFAIYDRMAVSDPSVHATMQHLITPLLASQLEVKPASPDPIHLEQAAFVDSCFHQWMDRTWTEILDDQLKYLRWGHALLEGTYYSTRKSWQYVGKNGEITRVPERDVMVWKNWAPRLPRTIYRWLVDGDELYAVQQFVYVNGNRVQDSPSSGAYRKVTIPIEKCILLVNEKVGDDYWGQSILRGAYKPWWLLEGIQRVAAIGMERFHVGTPMVRMKQNATPAQKSAALAMAMEMRSGERTAVLYGPDSGIDCDEESVSHGVNNHAIWILTPNNPPPDALPLIRHLESNIFTNILARFMDLGQRETGARATAEVQRDPFFLGLLAVAQKIKETWNRGPIRQLLDLNYPNVDAYPTIEMQGITPQDEPIIANVLALLGAQGFVTPDGPTEQWLRNLMSMPDKVIDAAAEARYEASPANVQRTVLPVTRAQPGSGAAKPPVSGSRGDSMSVSSGVPGGREGGDSTRPTTGLSDPFWLS